MRGGLSAAATYLGLSEQQLFEQLQSGRSLGRITRALADRVEANLKQRVGRLVNGSFGFGLRGRGLGPPRAPGGDQDSASPT